MMFPSFRLRPSYAVAPAILTLLLAGCGSSSTPSAPTTSGEPTLSATPTPQATEPPKPETKVIDVTLDGTSVKPSGTRVEVAIGQPVILRINAANAGELHVHSSPGQEIGYPAGMSEVTLKLDRPGIVDVEDHELGALIVQLQVS